MTISVTRLGKRFAAEIGGVDITRPVDDETQVAFSLRFGNLEVTKSMNPAAGEPIPADDRRMIYQLANML
jgi:hypothetical protein